MGTWVFKECIQRFKITFFRHDVRKQEEKCLRYFSASFQNFSTLIIEDKGNNQKEKKKRNCYTKKLVENAMFQK